ncbi:MAG: PQQ-binding-like beta-propeller repeat protein [Zavarzinella sp.]
MLKKSWLLSGIALLFLSSTAMSTDWIHWRGPYQNGFVPETGLPDDWNGSRVGKENLIWKIPMGSRSTPIVMDGKLYLFGAEGDVPRVQTQAEKLLTGEKVSCLDAATGKELWSRVFNVYLTDIVTNRLAWSPMTADPVKKQIYFHTTGGYLVCLNDKGETVWQRQLTEEFGRVTGYGGRVSGPICDSGLVIIGMANAAWGDRGRGGNRFVAFDQNTGEVVWWSDTTARLFGTYASNAVIAVINGERLLLSGGADGCLHAFQVRTGKRIWSYYFAEGIINPSPVVVGNLVLLAHGVENPGGGDLGRVICVDASKIKDGEPELVWEFRDGTRFGLSSLATDGKLLYVPDDAGKLFCFDIFKKPTSNKSNKFLWKFNYATLSRGAPVIADNKIFITAPDARFHIIQLNGKKEPEDTHETKFRAPPGGSGLVEVHSTPAIVDGRIYLSTRDETFCIGDPKWKGKPYEPLKLEEPAIDPNDAVAQLQVYPADVTVKPGDTVAFQLRGYNARGQLLSQAKLDATWSLPTPPPPPGSKSSLPALDATIDSATGKITVNAKKPNQGAYVLAKVGNLTATARVRVLTDAPYAQDFEKLPVAAIPGGWVNTGGKFRVVEMNGNKVLFKTNNNPRPPLARAYAYFTQPSSTGYTIQADIMAKEVREKLPDAGVLANRYTFYLDGKTDAKGKRSVRLICWEALPRIDVEAPFDWKGDTWYTVKLTVTIEGKKAMVRGKAWPKDQPEPEKWTIEFEDPMPNTEGAAAIYGYIPNADEQLNGAEAYFDNIKLTPNGK